VTPDKYVVILRAPTGLHRFLICGSEITIGRSAECDIAIGNKFISRQHASLHFSDDKVEVKNLNFSNGMKVGGKRVPQYRLVELGLGEVVTLCHGFDLRVRLAADVHPVTGGRRTLLTNLRDIVDCWVGPEDENLKRLLEVVQSHAAVHDLETIEGEAEPHEDD
jgi:predicted component of type VI protein secretion system